MSNNNLQAIVKPVADMFIDFADKNGIRLTDHFKDADEFQAAMICFTTACVMDKAGLGIDAAIDFVVGSGTYQQIYDRAFEIANSSSAYANDA